jgi:tRNA(Arg) A34 adenosine deaminase TadA
MDTDQNHFMGLAIKLAREAGTAFAAIIVNENNEHVSAVNTVHSDNDSTAHAEVNVIRKLKFLKFSEKRKLTLFTTCEPCPMCMSAVIWAGIGTVVFGCSIDDIKDKKNQIDIKSEEIAAKSWYTVKIEGGIKRAECLELFDL